MAEDPKPLPIPRPAWCPECGSDYAGESAVCPKCGYDAGGELVLYEDKSQWTAPGYVRKSRRESWGGVAVTPFLPAAGAFMMWWGDPLTDDGESGFREIVSLTGLMLIFTSPLVLAVFAGALIYTIGLTDGGPFPRRRMRQLRLSPRGVSERKGFGPVRWEPWSPHASIVGVEAGNVRIREAGRSRKHGPTVSLDGTSAEEVAALARRFILDGIRSYGVEPPPPQWPDPDRVTHCPDCGYFLLGRQERPLTCPECGWVADSGELVLFGDHPGGPRDLRHIAWAVAGVIVLLVVVNYLDDLSPGASGALCATMAAVPVAAVLAGLAWKRGQTEADRREAAAREYPTPPGRYAIRLRSSGLAVNELDATPAVFDWSAIGNRIRIYQCPHGVRMIWRIPATLIPFMWADQHFVIAAESEAAEVLAERLRSWGVNVDLRL